MDSLITIYADTEAIYSLQETLLSFKEFLSPFKGIFVPLVVAFFLYLVIRRGMKTYRQIAESRLEMTWRQQKLDIYRELMESLGLLVNFPSSMDATVRWSVSSNRAALVAPQHVLNHIRYFSEAGRDRDMMNEAIRSLLRAIRQDLAVFHADENPAFDFVTPVYTGHTPPAIPEYVPAPISSQISVNFS